MGIKTAVLNVDESINKAVTSLAECFGCQALSHRNENVTKLT